MATRLTNRTVGANSVLLTIEASDWPAVPTVFFDGSCPLCRREIAHYRRSRYADRLAWVDLSSDQARLEVHGLSRQQAMQRLHVLDASGNWQIGAWAFAEMWSHLPRYRVLASLFRHTGLLPLLDRLYNVFARWRSRRRCAGMASVGEKRSTVAQG
jgi:predicted DCC family thiol-disulfide oxidoreductase YuxK